MFVKTQFDTIVNLAHYSKNYIDYSVKSPTSNNIYHEITATLEDNDNGGIKIVREKTLALIPANRKELPDSGENAKAAFNPLFEAILNNESAFDISGYYKQQYANNDETIKKVDKDIHDDYPTMLGKQISGSE